MEHINLTEIAENLPCGYIPYEDRQAADEFGQACYRAGRKEVVDWVEAHGETLQDEERLFLSAMWIMTESEWRDQLKEWGLPSD